MKKYRKTSKRTPNVPPKYAKQTPKLPEGPHMDHKKLQNERKEHPQKRDQSIEKVPSGPLPSDFHKNEPSAKILNPSEVQKSCSRRGGAFIFEDHREPTATILNPSEVQKSCSRRGGALIFDDHTEPSAKH